MLEKLCIFPKRCTSDSQIPMAARSKAWVCGRLVIGVVGSNPARGQVGPSLVSVYEGVSKIFRIDAVKIINLTTKRV
jgi:hypothetical protein